MPPQHFQEGASPQLPVGLHHCWVCPTGWGPVPITWVLDLPAQLWGRLSLSSQHLTTQLVPSPSDWDMTPTITA